MRENQYAQKLVLISECDFNRDMIEEFNRIIIEVINKDNLERMRTSKIEDLNPMYKVYDVCDNFTLLAEIVQKFTLDKSYTIS